MISIIVFLFIIYYLLLIFINMTKVQNQVDKDIHLQLEKVYD